MLPNITKMNPILKLFASKNMPLSLIILIIVLGFMTGMVIIYCSNEFCSKRFTGYKKIFISIFSMFLCVATAFVINFSLAFYYNIANKNINKTPIKTVFSSYRIAKIKQPKESDSVITYDASGNQKSEKPRTLFNVYLEQTKGVKTMELEHNVVLDVSKVNEDSFEIVLPDEKAATIKKEDAPEVFNALKKIKDDEQWIEVQKMIRNRQVKEKE